ncbi:hypothetical protein PO124_01220 [Bacillus licheniformis]|nr:hypothetical protein [Bacillus licheniformis]
MSPAQEKRFSSAKQQAERIFNDEACRPRPHLASHKDIPGSHVVIQSTDPDEQTILEAAQIAAYYSKAKTPLRFPSTIQNTPRQKPNGANRVVTYDSQQTVL